MLRNSSIARVVHHVFLIQDITGQRGRRWRIRGISWDRVFDCIERAIGVDRRAFQQLERRVESSPVNLLDSLAVEQARCSVDIERHAAIGPCDGNMIVEQDDSRSGKLPSSRSDEPPASRRDGTAGRTPPPEFFLGGTGTPLRWQPGDDSSPH